MGWTSVRTWVAGEIVTAAIMNSAVRDNLAYLKGVGQVPTIQSGLTIDNSLGSERLLLPLLSTAECTTVLNAEGEVAFDETTHQMKEYDGTGVRVLISSADVDDTPVNGADTVPVSSNWAYDFQQALTTAGDIAYATGAGVWARLGIGTAGQRLRTNAGEDAPEWGPTGQTQEIFVPAIRSSGSVTEDTSFPQGVPITQAGDIGYVKLIFPQDFTAITNIELIFECIESAASQHVDITTYWGAYNGGESWTVHTEVVDGRDLGATTATYYINHNIADLVNVAAPAVGDILVVRVGYDETNVNSNVCFSGIRLKYS